MRKAIAWLMVLGPFVTCAVDSALNLGAMGLILSTGGFVLCLILIVLGVLMLSIDEPERYAPRPWHYDEGRHDG